MVQQPWCVRERSLVTEFSPAGCWLVAASTPTHHHAASSSSATAAAGPSLALPRLRLSHFLDRQASGRCSSRPQPRLPALRPRQDGFACSESVDCTVTLVASNVVMSGLARLALEKLE